MAHQLTQRTDGRIEMAYAGETPWHGLGKKMNAIMTPEEARREALMEWDVEKRKLYFNTNKITDSMEETKDSFAIVRADNGEYFGTVGSQYRPIQTSEQAEFLRTLAGEGGIEVECAGTLYGGRRQFWACKVKGDRVVEAEKRQDRIKQYLTLANGHDGTLAFRCFFTPIRVVCNNTLNAAMRRAGAEGVTLRHTSNVQLRIKEARKILGLAGEYYDQLADVFQKMAETRVDKDTYDNVLKAIFDPKEADFETPAKFEIAKIEAEATKRQVVGNLGRESKLFGLTKITAWDAYNSLTFFSSHQMDADLLRRTDGADRHFERVIMGNGRRMQQEAFGHFATIAGVGIAASAN